MDVSHTLEVSKIAEIKILSDVRLISQSITRNISSKDNLHVQFLINGELQGNITCHLFLDKHELSPTDKNFIFPLFTEAMNILIGKQLSQDIKLKNLMTKLSPPKLSMISRDLISENRPGTQLYALELDGFTFKVLIEYNFEVIS